MAFTINKTNIDNFDRSTYTSEPNMDDDVEIVDFTLDSNDNKMTHSSNIKTEYLKDNINSPPPQATRRTLGESSQFNSTLYRRAAADTINEDPVVMEELEEMYVRMTVILMNNVPRTRKMRLMIDLLQVLDHHINGPFIVTEPTTEL